MDSEEIHEQRNHQVAKILKYFGMIMAFFYILIGLAIIYFPIMENLSNTIRYLLCVMLIMYGTFRFYRAIK